MTVVTQNEAGRTERPAEIAVWDPFVRIFHWSLVAAMAYEFLAEDGSARHEWVGYGILALVGLRVIWGFVGSERARFRDFMVSPRVVLAYGRDIILGHPRRYLGHNPAGAVMIILLILAITATGVSGWAMTTPALWGQEWIEELHEGLAFFTLALIAAHIIGVVLASLQHKENLVRAMITGRKSA